MFVARDVTLLFPTIVFAAAPALPLAPLCAEARRRLVGQGPRRQTPSDLQRDAAFQPLVRALVVAARQGLDELGYQAGLEPEVTALWATLAPAGQAEPLVRAGNAFFGGLLLGEAPGACHLRAADPRPQAAILQPAVSEPNAYNALEALVPVPPGEILLFPGWLAHGFAAAASDGERLAFRFSLLFRDFVAKVSPPNWDHPMGKGSRA